MEIEETKQKAVAQIEKAFADTPMPRKGNFWRGPHECKDIEKHLYGKHWKEVTPEVIWSIRECLTYLTPPAFRFYAPAYMLLVLLAPERIDTLLQRIVSDLSPSSGKEWSDWHNRRLKESAQVFLSNEADAVVGFLEVYQILFEAGDPYYADDFFIFDTKGKLERGILFWMYVRDGVDVSL